MTSESFYTILATVFSTLCAGFLADVGFPFTAWAFTVLAIVGFIAIFCIYLGGYFFVKPEPYYPAECASWRNPDLNPNARRS